MDQKHQIPQDYRLRAIIAHGDQMYGEHPYAFHLAYVEMILVQYGFDSDEYRAIAWLHDCDEDTSFKADDIRIYAGDFVADMVRGCSGHGETRKIRNAMIYENIRKDPRVAVPKSADRIANGEHSKRNGSRQYDMYRKEYPDFRNVVAEYIPAAMLERLDNLFY